MGFRGKPFSPVFSRRFQESARVEPPNRPNRSTGPLPYLHWVWLRSQTLEFGSTTVYSLYYSEKAMSIPSKSQPSSYFWYMTRIGIFSVYDMGLRFGLLLWLLPNYVVLHTSRDHLPVRDFSRLSIELSGFLNSFNSDMSRVNVGAAQFIQITTSYTSNAHVIQSWE